MDSSIVNNYKTPEELRIKNRQACKRYRQRHLHEPQYKAKKLKYSKERYYRLKSQGLCVLCSAPARTGMVNCITCGERSIENGKKLRDRWVANGLCTRCGKSPSLPAMIGRKDCLCERCYFKKTATDCLKSREYATVIGQKLKHQNYRCAYTGEKIILGLNDSLDHILPISKFPELRSDPSNVEWVTRKVNCMKWDSTREEFIATAYAVVRHYEAQRQLAV